MVRLLGKSVASDNLGLENIDIYTDQIWLYEVK